jgi:hypothetical protein
MPPGIGDPYHIGYRKSKWVKILTSIILPLIVMMMNVLRTCGKKTKD